MKPVARTEHTEVYKTIFRIIYSWAGSLYALTNKATVIAA